jgi:hypothetical protein
MTDRIADHLLNKICVGVFCAKGGWVVKHTLVALLSVGVFALPANAVEQEWWFDVEVILFERNLDTANISEKFEQSRLEQPTNDVLDLLTPYLKPDLSYLRAGLPYCRASNRLVVQTQYEQDFAFPIPVPVPVNESNGSASSQPNEQLVQDQGIDQELDQELTDNANEIPEKSFQYEVATPDIFSQPDSSTSLVQETDAEDVSPPNSEQNNSTILEPQTNIELGAEITRVRPPIRVEFIEWQVPSEFLCAYSEQIDASFASMTLLKDDVALAQSNHQITHLPDVINGTEWQQKRGAFLLPTSRMYMSDLYNKIKKQRDITPILHLNWRQEVKFGRDKGQTFRLFAGENFAQQFDANGVPLVEDTDSLFESLNQATKDLYIPEQELTSLTPEQQQTLLDSLNGTSPETPTEDLFAKIDTALSDDTTLTIAPVDAQTGQQIVNAEPATLKELWQLDGGITVYLRNLGRVPYLHIDSNLDFRQPVFDPKKAPQIEYMSDYLSEQIQDAIAVNQIPQPGALQAHTLGASSVEPNFLQSVNFNQLRRVISKQVHYFDHPLFGMIVRINRYRWPEIPSDNVEPVSQDN